MPQLENAPAIRHKDDIGQARAVDRDKMANGREQSNLFNERQIFRDHGFKIVSRENVPNFFFIPDFPALCASSADVDRSGCGGIIRILFKKYFSYLANDILIKIS